MKILWLSHMVPYPPKAGLIQRSYHLLREVASRHDVHLIAFNQRALMESFYQDPDAGLDEARRVLSEICSYIEVFDIPADHKPYGRLRLAATSLLKRWPYSLNWLQSDQFSRAVARAADHIDLVHVDTISLAPYRMLLPNVPAVLNHHNIESHLLLRRAQRDPNFLKRAYSYQEGKRLEKFERESVLEYGLNITCSELDSERLLKVNPAVTCEVIPNGVDTDFFYPDSATAETEPCTLAFVGTLGWGPNRDAVETITNSLWPAIVGKMPDARFLLVGANPPPSALRLADTDKRFEVTGFVDDVRTYLSRATVFLCPIDDGGGTKLKLLDAFAMGKAVVAHPVACEGIDAVEGVHVILARTAGENVAAISRIIENPALRRSLGAAARQLVVSEYSYSAIGLRLTQLYEQLAAN